MVASSLTVIMEYWARVTPGILHLLQHTKEVDILFSPAVSLHISMGQYSLSKTEIIVFVTKYTYTSFYIFNVFLTAL